MTILLTPRASCLASALGDILPVPLRVFLFVVAGGLEAVAIPQTSMTILKGLRNENILYVLNDLISTTTLTDWLVY